MLEKLKIQAYTDDTLNSEAGSCTLQINPETVTQNSSVKFEPVDSTQTYKRIARYGTRDLETLDFTFYLDATGVVKLDGSVADKLKELRSTVYDYDGSIHQTRYLKVLWGGITFPCVLTSMNVVYEMFNPSGTVLRAKVTLKFQEHLTAADALAEAQNQSPDMTHEVMVLPGDTLPLMCHRVYGDSAHYLTVAEVNHLDNIMVLDPGHKLRFPPVRN